MKTITMILEKGGVGKTLIAKELSAGLAGLHGQRVLTCDMDPQGNLTKAQMKINDPFTIANCKAISESFTSSDQSLSTALDKLRKYFVETDIMNDMSTVLSNPNSIHDAIYKTDVPNMHIIPATHKLTESDMTLKVNCQSNPCGRLTRALKLVEDDYDYVIIDNPPFTNALLYNSIYACRKSDDLVIIPISIDSGGLEGLYTTINDLINTANEAFLEFDFKILPVMTQGNLEDKTAIDMLNTLFPGRVFRSKIRFQGKPIKKASLGKYSLVLDDYDKKHPVAEDLRNFVQEVWEL